MKQTENGEKWSVGLARKKERPGTVQEGRGVSMRKCNKEVCALLLFWPWRMIISEMVDCLIMSEGFKMRSYAGASKNWLCCKMCSYSDKVRNTQTYSSFILRSLPRNWKTGSTLSSSSTSRFPFSSISRSLGQYFTKGSSFGPLSSRSNWKKLEGT